MVDLKWLIIFVISAAVYLWVRRHRDPADALLVAIAMAGLLITVVFLVPIPIFVV
jgi:phosphate starvation-inducible membrane PsiE